MSKPSWILYPLMFLFWMSGIFIVEFLGGWNSEISEPQNVFWHHLGYFLILGCYLFFMIFHGIMAFRLEHKRGQVRANMVGLSMIYLPILFQESYGSFFITPGMVAQATGLIAVLILFIFYLSSRVQKKKFGQRVQDRLTAFRN